MSNKSCRQDVKARARQQLQALPMSRPENKPDLDTEEADRPKAGDGTKTAILNQAAQAAAQAPAQVAQRPMTAGRMALVAGSTGLAGAMMNRAPQPQQQQQQQVY